MGDSTTKKQALGGPSYPLATTAWTNQTLSPHSTLTKRLYNNHNTVVPASH